MSTLINIFSQYLAELWAENYEKYHLLSKTGKNRGVLISQFFTDFGLYSHVLIRQFFKNVLISTCDYKPIITLVGLSQHEMEKLAKAEFELITKP